MAKNWMAYEAAEVLLKGTDKTAVAEIGSRYPLFTVAVLHDGTEALLDILKAVAKTTARVVETGLKDAEDAGEEVEVEEEQEQEEAPKTKPSKTKGSKTKAEPEEEDEEAGDYEDMTATDLYKMCCKRGISGKCKSRSKAALIKLLKAEDAETEEVEEEAEDDGWDDEEEPADPYAGKTAKELYKMCMDRKIKAQPKKKAEFYADLLKKADEKAAVKTKTKEPEPEEEDEDDDWEI